MHSEFQKIRIELQSLPFLHKFILIQIFKFLQNKALAEIFSFREFPSSSEYN